MTVMVALLRGVNVGGTSPLAMAELRAIAVDLGYDDVATYIQSGNLVLSSSDDAAAVEHDLHAALAERTDVRPAVMVRTRAQLAEIVRANPFVARGEDPTLTHVTFMSGPASEGLANLNLPSYAPEEVIAVGSELFMFAPNGLGRSKLATYLLRQRGAVGTMRNWRTVTKLRTMLDDIAR